MINFAQIGILSSSNLGIDENGNGQQAILVIGDSTGGAGTNGTTGPGPTPTAGTAYYYRSSNNTVIEIGANDLEFARDSPSDGSQWPQFAVDFYNKIGKKAVIIPCAKGGSEISPNGVDNNNWSTTGDLYSVMIGDATSCMGILGVTKPRVIFIFLGINDSLGTSTLTTVESDLNSLVSRLQTSFPGTDIVFYQPGKTNVADNGSRLVPIRHYIKNAAINNSNVYLIGDLGAGPSGLLVDNIHRNQTGQNLAGSICARWVENSSYGKWSRAIISSHYSDLSTTRKNLIAGIDSNVAAYLSHEALFNFKTVSANDVWNDWCFYAVPTDSGVITYTTNDSISTNGTTQYLRSGWAPSVSSITSSQDDVFIALKFKTVTTAAGTSATGYGGINAGTIGILLQQRSTGIRFRINDITDTDYATDTQFAADTEYLVARDGGTKYLFKNGSSVASAAVASTGLMNVTPFLGCFNNNGAATNFLNASYEHFRAGKHTTADQAAFYTLMESIHDGW